MKTFCNYHQIVDSALAKERKILEDATLEADQIIHDAQFIRDSSKRAVNQALETMVHDVQKESIHTASNFMNSYSVSLKDLASSSLTDFENIAKGLEGDMQKQIQEFRQTLLPNLEKELEEYKKIRLKQSEETITNIVQKASQEFFNKSIAIEDHQKLLIDALEKAKAEGIFN